MTTRNTEFHEQEIHGGDIYRHPGVCDFSSNMNPLGTPESVIKAAASSMAQISAYPDIRQTRLREKLAVCEQVSPEMLLFGNGAAELIYAYAQALRPEKALLVIPGFAEYEAALRTVDCKCVYYMLSEERDFAAGEDLVDRITEDLDTVLFCSPNNPTGRCIPATVLEKAAEKCSKLNIRFFIDECFLDFTEDEKSTSMKRFLADNPMLFILKAFTKRYAMAGLRLGYAICPDAAFRERVRSCIQPWNVSIPAQEAGIAALDERLYLEESLRVIERGRVFLTEELRKRGYRVFPSETDYLLFRGPDDLWSKLLQQGILIRDCSNYRGLTNGYYRIAVRREEENQKLLDAIDRIKEDTWQKQS